MQIGLASQVASVQNVKDHIDFAEENGCNTVILYLEAIIYAKD